MSNQEEQERATKSNEKQQRATKDQNEHHGWKTKPDNKWKRATNGKETAYRNQALEKCDKLKYSKKFNIQYISDVKTTASPSLESDRITHGFKMPKLKISLTYLVYIFHKG